MIPLEQAHCRIEICPARGARILSWRYGGSENLLDVYPGESDHLPEGWPTPKPDPMTDPGRGHIVWAGPQSRWWSDQDEIPALRDASMIWPPDPVLTESPYTILSQSASHIVLQSEPSPYLGLQFTKTVEILPDGNVRVHVKAVNCSDRTQHRNLWFNFRANAAGREWVFAKEASAVRIAGTGHSTWEKEAHSLTLGPEPGEAKCFIEASRGKIICEATEGHIHLDFQLTPPELLPEGQGAIEIYRANFPDQPPLLELEHHGPLHALAPGEHMEREERWSFHPYTM